MTTIEEQVRFRFAALNELGEDELDMNANLFTHYGLDSVKAVRLISDIEVEHDIDVPDEDAQKICCLNDVVSLIRRKKGLEVHD